jgi:glycosyltransferase involved in cell wall biosynthesis
LTSGTPRIVIVTSRLDVGGTERHIARILPALQQRGFDVALYVMERGGPLEGEIAAFGIPVAGPSYGGILHWPLASLALARWLCRERPDVVHFFLPRPYLFGSLAAELAGHPLRLMSRRSLTDYRAKYPLLGSIERILHRRTFGILGNSQAVIDQLATEVDEPSKLALIHNGIELPSPVFTGTRQRVRDMLRIPDEALVISVIANLIAYKGHRDLIAALALIKERLAATGSPRSWRLLVIGRDDGIGGELKAQAQASGIADHVAWLGERNDVEDLLAASDIFVLPSHQEGFSNALLEAMAARLPVVATSVGGNRDAVVENETGLLVPARDPDALAPAILTLAGDADLRRRFGEAGRRRVEQLFSLQACVDRYERLYRALGEASPPPISVILRESSTGSGRATAAAASRATT